jgi:hypothetical protein
VLALLETLPRQTALEQVHKGVAWEEEEERISSDLMDIIL